MRNKVLRTLFPDPPKPKPASMATTMVGEDMCDACLDVDATSCPHLTLTIDLHDPLRDTPEKARRYDRLVAALAERNDADAVAAAKILGVKPKPTPLDEIEAATRALNLASAKLVSISGLNDLIMGYDEF